MTAVTDEFPYYLRPKKAVFSGLICVAMYLMGLILTTDVSDTAGRTGATWGRVDACSSVSDRPGSCCPTSSPPPGLSPSREQSGLEVQGPSSEV